MVVGHIYLQLNLYYDYIFLLSEKMTASIQKHNRVWSEYKMLYRIMEQNDREYNAGF